MKGGMLRLYRIIFLSLLVYQRVGEMSSTYNWSMRAEGVGGVAVGDGVGLTVGMDMLGHQRLAPGTYPRTANQPQTPI